MAIWRDITTAPKDGRRIIVCDGHSMAVVVWENSLGGYWHLLAIGAYAEDSEYGTPKVWTKAPLWPE